LFGTSIDEGPRKPDTVEDVYQYLPEIDADKCTRCGECAKVCKVHSIFFIPDTVPVVMPHMCSGCEVCWKICPAKAISSESQKQIGNIYTFNKIVESDSESNGFIDLWVGRLKIGEVRSVFIIEKMLEKFRDNPELPKYDYVILDTSPGTHCDVELCLKSSDYAACITEPTPFGHHDLNRILDLAGFLKTPTKIVINRFGMGHFVEPIEKLAEEKSNGILGKIPLDKQILESYAMGVPFVIKYPGSDLVKDFMKLIEDFVSWMNTEKTKGGT